MKSTHFLSATVIFVLENMNEHCQYFLTKQSSTGRNTRDMPQFKTSVHHGMLNMLIMCQQMHLSMAKQVTKGEE